MEEIIKASTLEVCLGAMESTLSTDNVRIGELESQFASKNPEFDAAAAELERIKRHPRFGKDAGRIKSDQLQSQGHQNSKV